MMLRIKARAIQMLHAEMEFKKEETETDREKKDKGARAVEREMAREPNHFTETPIIQ